MKITLPRLTPTLLHYFENCQGCAACAPSCPYYYVDSKYSPVEKAEWLREMLRRRYTAAGRVLRGIAGAKMPSSNFGEIMKYAYRCADCGHCYVTCPFGIDSGHMVKELRAVLYSAGYAPQPLKELAELEASGKYLELPWVQELWGDFVKAVEAPVGKRGADVLLFISAAELALTRDTILNAARLLKAVGEDFTLPERPLGVFPPIGAVLGDVESARSVLAEIFNYVESLGVKKLVLLNGCYTYPYLRFEASNMLKRRPKFEVLHVVELLSRYLEEGRLKLRQLKTTATFHDPCHLARRGGVTQEPRAILEKIAAFREPRHGGLHTECLGGGGIGLVAVAERLAAGGLDDFSKSLLDDYNMAAFRRVKELREVGAEVVATACPLALEALRRGGAKSIHIVDLVAEALP